MCIRDRVTPFAQKLNPVVKTHRVIAYPKNVTQSYKPQIDKMLRRISIKAGTDAPQFAPILKIYLDSVVSMGEQLKRIDATLVQNKTTIDIEMFSVESTNIEKFFLAQKPAAFDLANRVPTDRPFYLESEWHLGEAEPPVITSVVDMMTAIDDTADWTCLLYTSPSPRDATLSRMPSSA